ncbi:hypothetical protein MYCTH_2297485 [Thermothelomyces thermophilus ATCC 42464]|uniref:Mpv17/PMP22 family protein n=1 Tax=Thermothelomyces thermophilus (strain ATCC 42464 / BCRC 31852 / DSM 1799) TaxID=573729 RepID=G2Q5Z8_THET4|nr:uncharacterized protein MYCTH_2297485 [Thermothelomyces thermophilus ATCC 42464]AEO54675.1 hypothetical protein MYCTH_2297485 [Thermothelomyces thermophilus ATCC 42464]
MAPPIVSATIQTAIISAISNILAQAITAHQTGTPLIIDPIPVFQYALFSLLSTPPNFLWQDFLESTFPAYGPSASAAPAPAAGSKDAKGAAPAAAEARPRLNKRNTVVKTLLDQTVGMAANTVLFSLFMHGIRQGMAHHYAAREAAGDGDARFGGLGLGFLLGSDAVRYRDVAWASVWAKAKGEFWDLAKAGWRFWPLVSLVNYVFVTSVEARSLVGALAGLGWGIYLCLVTGQ